MDDTILNDDVFKAIGVIFSFMLIGVLIIVIICCVYDFFMSILNFMENTKKRFNIIEKNHLDFMNKYDTIITNEKLAMGKKLLIIDELLKGLII